MRFNIKYSPLLQLQVIGFGILIFCNACKKLVQIDPPIDSITSSQVFADSANAVSALANIYSNLEYSSNDGLGVGIGSGAVTMFCGMSADELLPLISGGDQFSTNTLDPSNNYLNAYFWDPAYLCIYETNAVIEGLEQ